MKTTIEMHGYEITIEETEGMISVSATKDGETVEEFELEAGDEGSESGDEDVIPFGEDGEEEDFGSEGENDEEMGEEEEEMGEEEEEHGREEKEEGALESFSAFFKRSKVKRVNESKKIAPKTVKRTTTKRTRK